MIGALVGDIAGSRFEFESFKSKDFDLFHKDCFFTDDSVMTIAIAKALLESSDGYADLDVQAVHWMQKLGRAYPDRGYGGMFYQWLYSDEPKSYHSYGNGAAMRVSPCGFAGNSFKEVQMLADKVTRVTHDHPEGLKGAEATAIAVYRARVGETKEAIYDYIVKRYYHDRSSLEQIRATYSFDETCRGTVPVAIRAFYESSDFVDAVKNAISAGGDADTLGAITGSIAGAYYGVPETIKKHALSYLDERLKRLVDEYLAIYPLDEQRK